MRRRQKPTSGKKRRPHVRDPLVERLQKPIRKRRPRRNWAKMSDVELVEYAQNFIDENRVRNRNSLQKKDCGIYQVLVYRKLLDKVEFKADERAWRKYNDNELVAYTQKFVHENEVGSRIGLQEADSGLYSTLITRKLLDELDFKADERAWRLYSDEELVEYARGLVEETGVESRRELERADGGLYQALLRRKLIDSVGFKADERKWSRYSDDELVAYAQRFVEENGIRSRYGLEKADSGIYKFLWRRKLLDRVEFRTNERAWRYYSDDELVGYAQKFVDDNGIKSKSGLLGADGGLYQAFRRRRLLDKLNFKADERKWGRFSNNELVEYAKEFVVENGLRFKTDLAKVNSSLFWALQKRNLIGRVGFETDTRRKWSQYSFDELVDCAQKYVEENDVRNRYGLYSSDAGLYDALRKRRLLDRVEFEPHKRRNWKQYSDDELVAYTRKFLDENGIESRNGLKRVDGGLSNTLYNRNLMDRVFATQEQDTVAQGMQEILDAITEFGGEA